jgi:hypothetical protein
LEAPAAELGWGAGSTAWKGRRPQGVEGAPAATRAPSPEPVSSMEAGGRRVEGAAAREGAGVQSRRRRRQDGAALGRGVDETA